MSKNLRTARADAIAHKANVYQVGFDSFVTSHCEVEGGRLVFAWAAYAFLNGQR